MGNFSYKIFFSLQRSVSIDVHACLNLFWVEARVLNIASLDSNCGNEQQGHPKVSHKLTSKLFLPFHVSELILCDPTLEKIIAFNKSDDDFAAIIDLHVATCFTS